MSPKTTPMAPRASANVPPRFTAAEPIRALALRGPDLHPHIDGLRRAEILVTEETHADRDGTRAAQPARVDPEANAIPAAPVDPHGLEVEPLATELERGL